MPRWRSGWSPPRPPAPGPRRPLLTCRQPARRGRNALDLHSSVSVWVNRPAPGLHPPIIADHVIRITRSLARSPGSASSPALHNLASLDRSAVSVCSALAIVAACHRRRPPAAGDNLHREGVLSSGNATAMLGSSFFFLLCPRESREIPLAFRA